MQYNSSPNQLRNLCEPFGSPYGPGPSPGRPPLPKDEVRHIRKFRFNDVEWRQIKDEAAALGITVSALVRDRALGRRHRSIDRMDTK